MPISRGFAQGFGQTLSDALLGQYSKEDEEERQIKYLSARALETEKERRSSDYWKRQQLATDKLGREQQTRENKLRYQQQERISLARQRQLDRQQEERLKMFETRSRAAERRHKESLAVKKEDYTLNQKLLVSRYIQARKEIADALVLDERGKIDEAGAARWRKELNLIERAMLESGLDPGRSGIGIPEPEPQPDFSGLFKYLTPEATTQSPLRPDNSSLVNGAFGQQQLQSTPQTVQPNLETRVGADGKTYYWDGENWRPI